MIQPTADVAGTALAAREQRRRLGQLVELVARDGEGDARCGRGSRRRYNTGTLLILYGKQRPYGARPCGTV